MLATISFIAAWLIIGGIIMCLFIGADDTHYYSKRDRLEKHAIGDEHWSNPDPHCRICNPKTYGQGRKG
jgi:hypothetical protein